MSYNPTTVVNYFIKKYGEDGKLSPMKLLKLTYIAYGWYLATYNSRLLSEQPQAWQYGPVFPRLYEILKPFGRNFIKQPLSQVTLNEELSEDDAKFLDKVWNIYGEKDGIYLSALTHKENTPWSKTYPRGYNLIIPDELIKQHYDSLSN